MQLEVYASESLGFVSQTATMVQLIVISPFADSMPGQISAARQAA